MTAETTYRRVEDPAGRWERAVSLLMYDRAGTGTILFDAASWCIFILSREVKLGTSVFCILLCALCAGVLDDSQQRRRREEEIGKDAQPGASCRNSSFFNLIILSSMPNVSYLTG